MTDENPGGNGRISAAQADINWIKKALDEIQTTLRTLPDMIDTQIHLYAENQCPVRRDVEALRRVNKWLGRAIVGFGALWVLLDRTGAWAWIRDRLFRA